MNTTIKQLLVAALMLSATQVHAYTNQTYMNARSHSVNLAQDMTTAWEASQATGPDRFGGTFQVTGFYTDSASNSKLGKYFLFGDSATQTLDATALQALIPSGYPLLNAANGATIKLNPSQSAMGVTVGYHQELDKLLNGLYFCVKIPLVRVANQTRMTTSGDANNAKLLQQALTGKLAAVAATNLGAYTPLLSALFDNKKSAAGIADIDVQLGYAFLHEEKYGSSLSLAITIPTGNEATGKTVFEPIYGNGNHFALGGGVDFQGHLWGDVTTNLKLNAALKYRYLFQGTEKRTLGIKGVNGGQYSLLLDASTGTATLSTLTNTPAANQLTQNLGVTPGSQLDGIVALTLNHRCWSFDLGYELYFREEESVKMKDAWNDTKWARVTGGVTKAAIPGANAGTAYAAAGQQLIMTNNDGPTTVAKLVTDGGALQALPASQLSTDAARTPQQFSNKIYAGVGYIFREFEYPVFLGAGAHYEFAAKNSVVQNWGVNGKVGITF